MGDSMDPTVNISDMITDTPFEIPYATEFIEPLDGLA